MQKKDIILTLGLLVAPMVLSAESFAEFMRKADSAGNIAMKYSFWDQAAAAGNDTEKMEAWQKAFKTAIKTKDSANLFKYGSLLKDCKGLPDAERVEAVYQVLSNTPPDQVKPEEWEAFFAMPGAKPEQIANGRFAQADTLLKTFHTKQALAVLEKIRSDADCNENIRVDAALKIANVLFSQYRNREALALLDEMQKDAKLSPRRQGELNMLIGKSILQGYGYYPNLEDADYEKAYTYLRKAAETRTGNTLSFYLNANFVIIKSLFTRKKYAETLELCKEVIATRKVTVDLGSWRALKSYMGQCKVKLGDYEGAIADFETLRDIKYEPFDNCRYLGEAYYLNRQYSLALGCFDEALKALKGCEDDRPVWCQQWISKLRWFTTDGNGEKLQKSLAEYEGKTGTVGMAKKAAPKKKEIKKMEDITVDTGNLADEGLDL